MRLVGGSAAVVAALLFASMAPSHGHAGTVQVPYSVTFETEGTVSSGVDNLNLFGGGDLTGDSFTNTATYIYMGPPWKALHGLVTNFEGPTTDEFTINGMSITLDSTIGDGSTYGGAENAVNSGQDVRGGGIFADTSPYSF
jgi:hypothetical protein